MFLETKRLQVKKPSKFTHPYHSTHYGEVQPFLPRDISTHVPCIIITLFPVLVLVHGMKTKLFVATLGVTISPLTCFNLPLKESALFCWKVQGSLPSTSTALLSARWDESIPCRHTSGTAGFWRTSLPGLFKQDKTNSKWIYRLHYSSLVYLVTAFYADSIRRISTHLHSKHENFSIIL